jgi:DNA gyrase subunit B/topoisomerase-4 subunit B
MGDPRHASGHTALADARETGPGSELFVVEGDSALSSVCAVGDGRTQGVLAFQGKPLNAWFARPERVAGHAPYQRLAQALGLVSPVEPVADGALEALRYGRLLMLFDPDADGIHIAALLALYLLRWQPALVRAGRVSLVRAPMVEIVGGDGEVHHADHPLERDACLDALRAADPAITPRVVAHRGLGSIRPAVLRERCVDPATRRAVVLTTDDIEGFARALSQRT